MNLASDLPSANVIDVRNVTFNPTDSPLPDLVIMTQGDYSQALANTLIAGCLIGLAIGCLAFCVYLVIQGAKESARQSRRANDLEQRLEVWRALRLNSFQN